MRAKRLSDQQMGALAESLLATEIQSVGGNPTKPDDDLFGWDIHAEFELGNPSAIKDKSRESLTAYFQVKASRTGRRRHSIELRNMRYALEKTTPFFFVFFEFDRTGTKVLSVDLIHFDHVLISKTLEILRKASIPGTKRPNPKTTIVKAGENDALTEPYGKSLHRQIISIVGDPIKYAAEKLQLINSVGYDKNRSEIRFEAKIEADMNTWKNQMLKMALGGAPVTVNAESIMHTDIRFKTPLQSEVAKSGKVTMSANVSNDWLVELRDPISGLTVTRRGALYSSNSIHKIFELPLQTKWSTDLFSIKICEPDREHKSPQVSLTAQGKGVIRGSEIPDLTRTYKIFHTPGRVQLITHHLKSGYISEPINIALNDHTQPESIARRIKTLTNAEKLLDIFPALNRSNVSVAALIEEEYLINHLTELLFDKSFWLQTNFPKPPNIELGQRIMIAKPSKIPLGELTIVFCLLQEGELKKSDYHANSFFVEGVISKSAITELACLPSKTLPIDWDAQLTSNALKHTKGNLEKVPLRA